MADFSFNNLFNECWVCLYMSVTLLKVLKKVKSSLNERRIKFESDQTFADFHSAFPFVLKNVGLRCVSHPFDAAQMNVGQKS